MALSRKLMTEGEREVMTVRTHVKVLFLPVLALLVVCGLAGFLLAVSRDSGQAGPLRIVILVVAAVLIVWWTLVPFLRWLALTYTITNRRLVEQTGLLTRTGRIIPWNRVNDVAFEKNLNDRMLGCGTLIIHDASEQTGLRLKDVPHVEDVHRTLTDLVFDIHSTNRDDHRRTDDEQI